MPPSQTTSIAERTSSTFDVAARAGAQRQRRPAIVLGRVDENHARVLWQRRVSEPHRAVGRVDQHDVVAGGDRLEQRGNGRLVGDEFVPAPRAEAREQAVANGTILTDDRAVHVVSCHRDVTRGEKRDRARLATRRSSKNVETDSITTLLLTRSPSMALQGQYGWSTTFG